MLDVILIIFVVLVIFSFTINIFKKIMDSDNVSQTRSYDPDEQNVCEHEWEDISRTRLGHIIYCPKCDVRIDVSDSDWADILIEKRYGGKEK